MCKMSSSSAGRVSRVLIFLVAVALLSFGRAIDLHDSMTDEELMRYFQTDNRNRVPEYQVVHLAPAAHFSEENPTVEYRFSVFNESIFLKLDEAKKVASPTMKTYIHDENGTKPLNSTPQNCHYLYKKDDIVASLSLCDPDKLHGLILTNNSTLEIQPFSGTVPRNGGREDAVPHIVKKARFQSEHFLDELFPTAGDIIWPEPDDLQEEIFRTRQAGTTTVTAEVALFFDEAAYKIFAPFFDYDDRKLQNMLLAYVNGVQALYHHPSLGRALELVLVRLDIMKKQPKLMPHYDGERSMLLDSFCEYQSTINPKDDSNPDHWDMALYVSGLDFFAYENGKKSGVTMGLATVGGVCLEKYACVIAEFGTTNVFGKPYPSAGFTSVYILAHEIGHNLGMHHDSSGNGCSKEGYIMSPSRGTNGETQWSTCSANVMSNLNWAKCLQDSSEPHRHRDHARFLDSPGRIYTAKKQCELLLRDKDAAMSPEQRQNEICYNLQCKTPRRSGYYFAGPALDGTPCGTGQYCYGGHCTTKQLPKPVRPVHGGWSSWKNGSCHSGCVFKSKGVLTSTRECNSPAPVNGGRNCAGLNRQYHFCTTNKLCQYSLMRSVVDYASTKCKEFSRLLPDLDPKGVGLQAPHEDFRVWTGCAIFCKRKDSGAFYTPRVELNDLGVSPYFPDGTWCHQNAAGTNFYCVQHHCLPETFQFVNRAIPVLDDIPFSQNAKPNRPPVPSTLQNYFLLSPEGLPVQTSFKTSELEHRNDDEEWETKDYVELPSIQKRFDSLVRQIDDFNYYV